MKNETKTIMYCYNCRTCTMTWGGIQSLTNERGEYVHCYHCSSPFIKFFHMENGKLTTERPPIGNAVALPDTDAPKDIPHKNVLGELYAIRSVMAMVSENIEEIESVESFFLRYYGDDYYEEQEEKFLDNVFMQHMGKWQRCYLPDMIQRDEEALQEQNRKKEELLSRIDALKNEPCGFMQKLRNRRDIKNLKDEVCAIENVINRITAHINKLKDVAAAKGSGEFIYNWSGECLYIYSSPRFTCNFFPFYHFTKRVYYLEGANRYSDSTVQFHRDYKLLLDFLDSVDKTRFSPKTVSDVASFMTQEEKDNLEREKKERFEDSRRLMEAAKETYKIIDYRDWKNVDLLIYYFETGRADDLKEALQLVDRQLQTNQIVEAINMASAEINKNMYQAVKALGEALLQSFSRLSAQIQEQGQTMKNAVEQQTAAINKFGAAQIDNQRMTNALLSSIDRSSAQLAENVDRQMKQVYGIY